MSRIFVVMLAALSAGLVLTAAQNSAPNIVLILADDLGWADLSCQGADVIETPNIDRLAREGVRFNQAYAMSVCSPSRAMLLTGRHAVRVGITVWIERALNRPANAGPFDAPSRHDLDLSEVTLAERLHDAGYLTAIVGKWHLGDGSHAPETQGFDINIGGTHWGAPPTYWWPYRGMMESRSPTGELRRTEFRYVPDLGFGKPGEYLTDRLTDEAMRVMDRAAGQPFFVYLAHYGVHIPLEAKAPDIERAASRIRPGSHHQNATYAAMVRNLDDNVGRVLEHLRQRGLDRNTVVIFSSDNGGYIGKPRGERAATTSNAPLRSGKGALYEGGIRVPLIIRWPGISKAGGVCQEPVWLADLFPTLAGREASATAVDGIDLHPLMRDPTGHLPREALYFHYPHTYQTTRPVSAIRMGDWKLLEYLEDGHIELYNLANDPSEQVDLAARETSRVDQLRARLAQWRVEAGAWMPESKRESTARP
ncbi:MAG: sulfatase [Opitutaceae bacterium]|nr:sulfatase [Opitutaceae bacterium]